MNIVNLSKCSRFDEFILRTIESGLQQEYSFRTNLRQTDEYFNRKDKVELELSEQPIVAPLSLDDLQGFFFMILIVNALAILSFFLELICFATRSGDDGYETDEESEDEEMSPIY